MCGKFFGKLAVTICANKCLFSLQACDHSSRQLAKCENPPFGGDKKKVCQMFEFYPTIPRC